MDHEDAALVAWQPLDGRVELLGRGDEGPFGRLGTVAGAPPGGTLGAPRAPAVLQRPNVQLIAWDDVGTIQLLTAQGGALQRSTLATRAEGPTTWVDPIPHGHHLPQPVSTRAVLRRGGIVGLRLKCRRTVLDCEASLRPSLGRSQLPQRTVRVRRNSARVIHLRLTRRSAARARKAGRMQVVLRSGRGATRQSQTRILRLRPPSRGK
jgi:hypothetical protein